MAEAALEQQRKKSRRKDEDGGAPAQKVKKKRKKKVGASHSVDAELSDGLVIDEGSSDSERAEDAAPVPSGPRRDAIAVLLEQCAGALSSPPVQKAAPTPEDKKRRPWKNTVKTYYQLPLDSNGEPKLPINIGSMVIHSLGKIDPSDAFHAKRYIWPLGFRSTRPYASMLDFTRKTDYLSEIRLDPHSHAPQFVVTPADDPEHPVISATASGAWTEIVRRISEARKAKTGKQMFTTVSGPEMFGFAHPAVAKLIQDMPGAKQCTKYLRQEFVLSARKFQRKTEDGAAAGEEVDDEIHLNAEGGAGGGEGEGSEDDD